MKLFAAAALILAALWPAYASAHETETKDNMRVTLHISPNETPIAGQKSQIRIIYVDAQNKFKLNDCDCRLTMQDAGNQTVLTTQLTPSGDNFSMLDYTFQNTGKYQLTVSGAPKNVGEFKPFSSRFDINVNKSEQQLGKENSVRQKELLVLVALIALSSLGTVGLLARMAANKD